MRRVRLITALLVAMGLVAAPVSCARQDRGLPERRPVLLIGVDGLEWNVMRPLLSQGKLPVMKRLMDRGSYGYLTSMSPTFSPVIWTTIATGKIPEKHGILNFIYPVSVNGKQEPRVYTSGHRKTKAIWNMLGDYGLVVNVIGWWTTYPAESINGVMVSQTNTTAPAHDPKGRAIWKGALFKGLERQVTPQSRQNEVMATLDAVEQSLPRITEEIFGRRPHPADPFSQLMWDETQWAFRADATYVRVTRSLLESHQPYDLLAVYLGGTDVAGHRFWRYAHPEQYAHPPSRDQIENFGGVIDAYYRYVDTSIGELLASQPEDVTVFIVSDHGMHGINSESDFSLDDPPEKRNSANHLDSPPGIIIAAGTDIVRNHGDGSTKDDANLELPTVGSVLDVTPTLLVLKGIPVGEDMDGRLMRGIIDPRRLEKSPVRFIHTHDTREWLARRSSHQVEAEDQSERLEQLRALGYIK